VKRESVLYGDVNNRNPENLTYQKIVEPLHNPSTRKFPLLQKCVPTREQITGMDTSYPLSRGAYSKFPPAVFRESYSLRELQQRAVTEGGELELQNDIIGRSDRINEQEDSEVFPELIAAAHLENEKARIAAIPLSELIACRLRAESVP
jgi:hypothetical protein